MATGQIRMTPDAMKEKATRYNKEGEIIGEIIGRLDSLLDELQGEWEGAASDAYVAKYEELRPAFQDAQSLLEQIAQALDATAQAVEATDNEIASKFNS